MNLPAWVKWVAQDADGSWWGYEVEPQQFDKGWYENELGRRVLLKRARPALDWQQSLSKSSAWEAK